MEIELEKYKDMVDGIVSYQGSVHYILNAFQSGEWNSSGAAKLNDLNEQQKQAVLEVMQAVAEAATHDVLACLSEQQVKFVREEVNLPDCPFGTTLFQDWAGRVQQLPWPDEEDVNG